MCLVHDSLINQELKLFCLAAIFLNNCWLINTHYLTPWGNSPGILQPRRSAVAHDKASCLGGLPSTGGLLANPVHRVGEDSKTPWGKPVSAIQHREEKSGSVALRPVEKLRPSTAYDAFQPHTRAKTRVPGQWVGYSCAVPGCHNSVGQMSPGRTQLLLLKYTLFVFNFLIYISVHFWRTSKKTRPWGLPQGN